MVAQTLTYPESTLAELKIPVGMQRQQLTLATARTIGGVSFDGSANINLPGVNTSGTQDTSGNAATATTLATARTIGGVSFDGSANIVPSSITISDETSDETCNVLFSTDSTGDIQPKTNSGFTYNSSTQR